jgi:hypothetical protein
MTPDQEQELVESAKRVAYLLDYLCRAVKAVAGKNLLVELPDFDPAPESIRPKRG